MVCQTTSQAVMVIEQAREHFVPLPLKAYEQAFQVCLMDNKPSCAASVFKYYRESDHEPNYRMYKLYRDCLKRTAEWDKGTRVFIAVVVNIVGCVLTAGNWWLQFTK